MRNVEHSNVFHRGQDFSAAEVRSAGRFSANEVREIMTRAGIRDLRQIGCPDRLFEKLLENRAKTIGFEPRTAPTQAPAPDLADRLQAISLF